MAEIKQVPRIKPKPLPQSPTSQWDLRYSKRHRLERVSRFPAGVLPPKRVRIYRRRDHYVLQVWDPATKKTVSTRVDGDLVSAIAKAREIETTWDNFSSLGLTRRKLDYTGLVHLFLADVGRRVDAEELSTATLHRYRTALRHFEQFVGQPHTRKQFPHASLTNQVFQQEFAAYLQGLRVVPKTAGRAQGRPLKSSLFIFQIVRAMFQWGADPNRGNLLPAGFANPFRRICHRQPTVARDHFGEPDIDIPMAVDFFRACDPYQLALFGTIMLYGLRASEPKFLFQEQIDREWLKVACLPELAYLTKGKRGKRFPTIPALAALWSQRDQPATGLLFVRRDAQPDRMPLLGATQSELTTEFQRRCVEVPRLAATARVAIRNQLLSAAGGLNYDLIEREFHAVADRLQWPPQATLKDFRHLFSTSLENCGVGEFYRRYFMGHSLGRTPIATYTHLNQLQAQFQKAIEGDLQPLVDIISDRCSHAASVKRASA
jgi:hypothetical protein